MRVGDKVLIMDENLKRGEWLTGSIIAVHPGDDGVIRKTTVQHFSALLLNFFLFQVTGADSNGGGRPHCDAPASGNEETYQQG